MKQPAIVILTIIYALEPHGVQAKAESSLALLTELCESEVCECDGVIFECELVGVFSLITVSGKTSWSETEERRAVVHAINITCVYEPQNLDAVLNIMPQVQLCYRTEFYLKNCLAYPALLQQPNITYEGTVEFDQYLLTPTQFFNQTRELTTLRLPVKFIHTAHPLPESLLHNLTNLKHLELVASSTFEEISWPLALWHTLYNLETLSIQLVALHTTVRGMQSAHFRDLRALKQLKLEATHMMTLSGELFTSLRELNRLSLRLNSLEELPPDLLRMQHKLVVLDISENRLQALPRGLFNNTPLLWELVLSNNLLSMPTNIIENVQTLSYLRKLDLGYNRLPSIWGTGAYRNSTIFTRQRIAEPFDLANFIDMIGDFTSSQKSSVESLNQTAIILRNNQITHFSLEWLAAAGIRCPYYLDLAFNEIRHVHAIFSASASTTCQSVLHLINNPLACDCELAWVYGTNILLNGVRWQCASPERLYGYDLQNLERADMCAWTPAWCPLSCSCTKSESSVLIINCNAARLRILSQIPRPDQLSLAESTLYIEHNLFGELPSNATFGYANVTRLYASHNRLNIVLPSHLPPLLRVLDLRANQLPQLSAGFLSNYLNNSATLTKLYLSGNPWMCDCNTELLLYTLRTQRKRIPDVDDLYCANYPNMTLLNVSFNDICKRPPSGSALITKLIITFLTILTLLLVLTLYYKYELELKIWLHAHNMTLTCCSVEELDRDKTFDAFISYSHMEADYVNRLLVPGLEREAPYFRVCTHERNWLAGAYIPEQIVESVAQSRRTIIILSEHFIASDWARMEFKTAHQFAVNERRARIILIKYGVVENMDGLDAELQAYLRMNTYLDSEDPRFWQKLRYAMPHKRGEAHKAGMLEVRGRVYVRGQVQLNQLASRK